ncbi:uncharacterized protein LOC128232967 [Mya arenaria]|uniref:uncharacterized protein LOC128232967 n=1 Tax=Mya arenaria TaxID=6604 RepID=UPI0022E02E50|nr:uncharacterized protein LOC128232967 [Mya arenaria]XP_052802745.1 uncharacterized protein LOC128232967 [Mya arenaria]
MSEINIEETGRRKHRRRSVRFLRRQSDIAAPNPQGQPDNNEVEESSKEPENVYGSVWMEQASPMVKKRRRRSSMLVRAPGRALDELADGRAGVENGQDSDRVNTESYLQQSLSESFSNTKDSDHKRGFTDNCVPVNSATNPSTSKCSSPGRKEATSPWSSLDGKVTSPCSSVGRKVTSSSLPIEIKISTPRTEQDISLTSRPSPASMSPDFPVSPGYDLELDHAIAASPGLSDSYKNQNKNIDTNRVTENRNESYDNLSPIKKKLLNESNDSEQDVEKRNASEESVERETSKQHLGNNSDLSLSDKENNETSLNVTPVDKDHPEKESPGFMSLCKVFAGKVVNFVKTSPSYLTGATLDTSNILNVSESPKLKVDSCKEKFNDAMSPLQHLFTMESPHLPEVVCNAVEQNIHTPTSKNVNEGTESNKGEKKVEKGRRHSVDSVLLGSTKKNKGRKVFMDTFNAVSKVFNNDTSEIQQDTCKVKTNTVKSKSESDIDSSEAVLNHPVMEKVFEDVQRETEDAGKTQTGVNSETFEMAGRNVVEESTDMIIDNGPASELGFDNDLTTDDSINMVTDNLPTATCKSDSDIALTTECYSDIQTVVPVDTVKPVGTDSCADRLTMPPIGLEMEGNKILVSDEKLDGNHEKESSLDYGKDKQKRRKRRAIVIEQKCKNENMEKCQTSIPKLSDLANKKVDEFQLQAKFSVGVRENGSKTTKRKKSGKFDPRKADDKNSATDHTDGMQVLEEKSRGKPKNRRRSFGFVNLNFETIAQSKDLKQFDSCKEDNKDSATDHTDGIQVLEEKSRGRPKSRRRSFGVVDINFDTSAKSKGLKQTACDSITDDIVSKSDVTNRLTENELAVGIEGLDLENRGNIEKTSIRKKRRSLKIEKLDKIEESEEKVEILETQANKPTKKPRGRPRKSIGPFTSNSSSPKVSENSGYLEKITEEISQVSLVDNSAVTSGNKTSDEPPVRMTIESLELPDDLPAPRKKRRRSAEAAQLKLQMFVEECEQSPQRDEAKGLFSEFKTGRKRKHVEESHEEIEKIYRNKNFVKPEEQKPWHTILEAPDKTGDFFGKKKILRHINFEKPTQMKLRRRLQKAVKNGWDPKKKQKSRLNDDFVSEKLDNLWSELDSEGSESLVEKLKSIVDTE